MDLAKKKRRIILSSKKITTEKQCLAHVHRGRDEIVTTDSDRIGIAVTLRQKQRNNAIRPIAFASRHSNDAKKNYLVGELLKLAVLCGLEKFRVSLYDEVV